MSDEAAFLAALKVNPADDTTRLVYADWLDEHGEVVKAEYLRLVVGLARRGESSQSEAPEVARLLALNSILASDWCYPAGERFMLVLYHWVDKVRTIIAIRELTGQGLGEAKATSEELPSKIFSRATYEHTLAGLEKLKATGANACIHPFEQTDLPDLVRYQILASLWHSSLDEEPPAPTPVEVTNAFAEFLLAAGVNEPQTAARVQDEMVLLTDNLTKPQAHNRSADLRRLLPTPPVDAEWSIEIYIHLMPNPPRI